MPTGDWGLTELDEMFNQEAARRLALAREQLRRRTQQMWVQRYQQYHQSLPRPISISSESPVEERLTSDAQSSLSRYSEEYQFDTSPGPSSLHSISESSQTAARRYSQEWADIARYFSTTSARPERANGSRTTPSDSSIPGGTPKEEGSSLRRIFHRGRYPTVKESSPEWQGYLQRSKSKGRTGASAEPVAVSRRQPPDWEEVTYTRDPDPDFDLPF